MHVEIQNRYLQKSALDVSWHLTTIKVPYYLRLTRVTQDFPRLTQVL